MNDEIPIMKMLVNISKKQNPYLGNRSGANTRETETGTSTSANNSNPAERAANRERYIGVSPAGTRNRPAIYPIPGTAATNRAIGVRA